MTRLLSSIASAVEWGIIAFAALMTTGAFDPAAAAEVEIQAVVAPLIADLQRMTGREITQSFTMGRATDEEIFNACHCHARGLFNAGELALGPSVDLGGTEGLAVFFHELVHALQWSEHGDASGCEEFLKRESEALVLERQWRMAHGARLPPMPFYTCTEKR